VIDDLRPFLQCSLHGVDIGGSFVLLTRPNRALADGFSRSTWYGRTGTAARPQ